MRIDELILLMNNSELKPEQVKEAIDVLDYEIDSAETIVADIETELHSRKEFQQKLRDYKTLKNRIKNEFKSKK